MSMKTSNSSQKGWLAWRWEGLLLSVAGLCVEIGCKMHSCADVQYDQSEITSKYVLGLRTTLIFILAIAHRLHILDDIRR